MKKILKQLLAFTLVTVMLLSLSVFAQAAFSSTEVSSHTVKTGVTYTKYSVKSGEISGRTQDVHTLTFNSKTGDYILMPFAGYAGTSATVDNQYKIATGLTGSRYSYEVAGVINGGFFGMSNPYGLLTGINISNGKLESAHLPFYDNCVCFNSDGSITPVYSNLSSVMEFGGKSYTNLLWYVNKRRTDNTGPASKWSDYDQVYYYDKSCGTTCDTYFAGTEILCNKVDNTEIAIDHTLVGEVVSVSLHTCGGTIGENQFILYYPDTSTGHTSEINAVKAGDTIKITVRENNKDAQGITSKAVGMMNNIGWLIKDGEDRTRIDSKIGTHGVTEGNSWVAYGWKDDGTVILMCNDGYTSAGITMRDIADQYKALGCKNVVRLDGGGSACMYLSDTGLGKAGFAQSSTRAVGDCLLVLKRSSASSTSLKNVLNNKMSSVSQFADYIPDIISYAQSVYDSSKSISGDYKHAIMSLLENGTPRGILEQCLKKSLNNNPDDYSDYAADVVEAKYIDAKRVYNDKAATDDALLAAATGLAAAIESAPAGTRISLGAKYVTVKPNDAYPDTGNCELTDGNVFNASALNAAWTGFLKTDKSGTDKNGDYTEIYLNLGSVKSPDKVSVSACHQTGWSIYAPTKVDLYASSNGTDYYLASELAPIVEAVAGTSQTILYTSSLTDISARYYMVRAYFGGAHLFIGEISLYSDAPANGSYYVTKGVDKFNSGVTTDSVVIFNKGTLIHTNSNLTWSTSYVCEKTDGGYKVTQKISPNGDNTYSVAVPSGGFIIAFHGEAYKKLVSKRAVQIGDICALTGIDIADASAAPLARVAFHPANTATYTRPAAKFGVFTSAAVAEYGLTEGEYIALPNGLSVETVNKNLFTDPRFTYTPAVKGAANIGTGAVYAQGGKTYTVYVEGDLNGDGLIKSVDYLLLKRIALNTYKGSEAQNKAAVIDGNTVTRSYALLKRHVLGTYTIQP